jgi:hypothetical protein
VSSSFVRHLPFLHHHRHVHSVVNRPILGKSGVDEICQDLSHISDETIVNPLNSEEKPLSSSYTSWCVIIRSQPSVSSSLILIPQTCPLCSEPSNLGKSWVDEMCHDLSLISSEINVTPLNSIDKSLSSSYSSWCGILPSQQSISSSLILITTDLSTL